MWDRIPKQNSYCEAEYCLLYVWYSAHCSLPNSSTFEAISSGRVNQEITASPSEAIGSEIGNTTNDVRSYRVSWTCPRGQYASPRYSYCEKEGSVLERANHCVRKLHWVQCELAVILKELLCCEGWWWSRGGLLWVFKHTKRVFFKIWRLNCNVLLYIFLSRYRRLTFNCKDTIVIDQYFRLGPSSGSIEFWCMTSSQYIM